MVSAIDWSSKVSQHSIFKDLISSSHGGPNSSVLAAGGSEIYVSSGSIVRYADLTTMKDYIELQLSDVDFEISAIHLNDSRSLLIVVGEHKLVVAYLPRGVQALMRYIKTQVVGADIHRKTTISQVKIHPYCASDTSLVVLTTDGFLRLYTTDISCDEADITVDLRSREAQASRSARCVGDIDALVPTSFSFGNGGDGWTTFSVFVLMQSGDLFSICPLLPNSCHMKDQDVENFDSLAACNGLFSQLHNRVMQAIDRGTRTSSGTNFYRPSKMLSPSVTGPALFVPAPLEFSTAEIAATSIHFMPTQPLNVLAIASDGKVDTCVLTEPALPQVTAHWAVSVHETIELDKTKSPNLRSWPSNDLSCYLIVHNQGIHKVSTPNLGDGIAQTSSPDINGESVADAADAISSEVELLLKLDTSSSNGVDFLNHDLDTFLIAISSTVHVQRIIGTPSPSDEADDPITSETSEELTLAKYQSLLSLPIYRAPSLQVPAKIATPRNISQKMIKSDVESLNALTDVVLQRRKELEHLMTSYISMHRRLAMQQKEFSRQQDKAKSIRCSLEFLSSPVADRVQEAKSRQDELENRFSKITQDLIKSHSPKLSEAERRYFEELTRIRALVHGPRGMLSRKAASELQLKQIRDSIIAKSHRPIDEQSRKTESPIRTTQLAKVRYQIESNEEVLATIRTKVERLDRVTTTV